MHNVADLTGIAVVAVAATLCGMLFVRLRQPAIVGYIIAGIILGPSGFELVQNREAISFFAELGVILLLFEVGLESRVKDMMKVGVSSLLVAILGVVAPILLGIGVGYALTDASGWQIPAFLGATLCATSVGITARVLKDLGRSQDRESKIILGAAVIDDVLGLVVLAVVSGAILEGENFQSVTIVKTIGLSFGFLAGALLL